MRGEVEIYAVDSQYDCPGVNGIKLDHVWVSTEVGPHNWNCYGRGRPENHAAGSRLIGRATGNIEWMAAVYGPEAEGRGGRDNSPAAAGCVELLHGVCHNAANRILALTEENADVSKAAANELVVLAFGKYGFGVETFIERLKSTADALNARNPGSVSEEELARTIGNVEKGLSVGAEFETLTDNLPQIRAAMIERTTETERAKFAEEYHGFQLRRTEAFASIEQASLPHHDARGRMGEFLREEVAKLLSHLRERLGAEAYAKAITILPQYAWVALGQIH